MFDLVAREQRKFAVVTDIDRHLAKIGREHLDPGPCGDSPLLGLKAGHLQFLLELAIAGRPEEISAITVSIIIDLYRIAAGTNVQLVGLGECAEQRQKIGQATLESGQGQRQRSGHCLAKDRGELQAEVFREHQQLRTLTCGFRHPTFYFGAKVRPMAERFKGILRGGDSYRDRRYSVFSQSAISFGLGEDSSKSCHS